MIVYLDMDGVLADQNSKCVELLGKGFTDFASSQEAWAEISKHPDIYRILDKMPDADLLVKRVFELSDIYPFEVAVLTAIPKYGKIPLCVEHKMEWLGEHYPKLVENFNIGPYSIDKQNHAVPGDVLIDDNHLNIEQWNAKGGLGILHTNAKDSLTRLEHYLEGMYWDHDLILPR